ncbi:flavoprotein [Powellomyces hirtus]|nr:flavoprotein [Powellomyces hirtus]
MASAVPTTPPRPRRIILAATGSVASIKMPLLVQRVKEAYKDVVELKIVSTNNALHFFDRNNVGDVHVLTDAEEWSTWTWISDPVLHIELRSWADAIVIAPLDANTLAKLATGLADNLLTCILRAWDTTKPVILCPAMNTFMWQHPFTKKHLDVCVELGYMVIEPIVKTLACGDTGVGAMAEPEFIANVVRETIPNVE